MSIARFVKIAIHYSLTLLCAQAHANSCHGPDGFSQFTSTKKSTKIFDLARKTTLRVVTESGKYYFYPTIAFALESANIENAIKTVKNQNKSLAYVPVEYIKKNGLRTAAVIGTYTYFGAGPTKFVNYFLLPGNTVSDYEAQLDDSERSDGITIYVDGVPDDNALAGYGEQDFNRRFGKQKNAYFIKPLNLDHMFYEIKELTKKTGQPIARLEIAGHGFPGEIEIGLGSLNNSNVAGFKLLNKNFAPNAEIRFLSCLLAANYKHDPVGENLLKKIGTLSLSKGGSVFASNHVVYADIPFEQTYHDPLLVKFASEVLSPLDTGLFIWIATNELLSSGKLNKYKKIIIPSKLNSKSH